MHSPCTPTDTGSQRRQPGGASGVLCRTPQSVQEEACQNVLTARSPKPGHGHGQDHLPIPGGPEQGKLSSSAQHGPTHNLVNPSFPGSNVPSSVHEKQWESQPKPQHNQKDLQKNWEKQQPVISTVGQGLLRYLVLCSVVSNSFRTPGL